MERQQVGVRFLLPNRTWKPIETLLATIDFRSYYWEIKNDEICGWRDIGGVYKGEEVIRALPLTEYYCISTKPNQFCLDIILCRIRGAFDYLMYPYYPAYMG